MSKLVNFVKSAVSANVAFAKSQVALIDATENADARFTASALAFQSALDNGATTRSLATAVKEATSDIDTRLVPFLYTSPTSVTNHALTGLIIDLAGGVVKNDEVLLGFQIQTVVKNAVKVLGTASVRELIASTETAQKAFDALERATRLALQEAKDAESEGAESEGEDEVTETGDLDKVELYLLLAIDQLNNAKRALSEGADLSDTAKGALESLVNSALALKVNA
jgi:hypothetical protein